MIIYEEGFNGGFEPGNTFQFNGGITQSPPPGVVVDALNSASGIGYLQMYGSQMVSLSTSLSNGILLKANTNYQLRFWAKTNTQNPDWARLNCQVSGFGANPLEKPVTLTTTYNFYNLNFTTNNTPPPNNSITFTSGFYQQGDATLLTYIDVVELIEIGPSGSAVSN